MKHNTKVILAIYPNARGFGYAFFEKPTEPRDCGIVSILPISNMQCLKRIQKFIAHYEPILVVLQDFTTMPTRKSMRVKKLVSNIVSFCQDKGLSVKEYSQEQIAFVFEQFKAYTKYQIAQRIVEWLPQFARKMPKIRKPWMCEDYHMGMFDAMALALTHYYMTE
jgi:Holliday junction resolvasome RuvABC endonuclease subunit